MQCFDTSLQEYTGLKTLYLECNALDRIEGLSALTNLRCLYLGENMITEIEGLDTLQQLETLDLSENKIGALSGLRQLPQLKTLTLAGDFFLHILITDCPALHAERTPSCAQAAS